MDFRWYVEIGYSNEIEQGDLIPDCPIVIPPSKFSIGEEPEIEIKLIDSVILSQSFARYFMRVGLPQDIVIEGY